MKYKTIKFYAKCEDLFHGTITDESGNENEIDGHVPEYLGGGDYVRLTIDLETGQILNWKPPTDDQIEEDIADSNGFYS